MKRVFVDMDGVLAKFNKDASIEEVATAGYFRKCIPQKEVIDAVREILQKKEDVEVFILSSVFQDDHSGNDKDYWLNQNGLEMIDKSHRIFVPYGMSKSKYLAEKTGLYSNDCLLDDFSKNLHEWHGIGIKLYNGINGNHGTWHGYSVHANADSTVIKNTLLGILDYAA